MPGISKHTGNNFGGISLLYYALQRDLDNVIDFDYDRDNISIDTSTFNNIFTQLRNLKRESTFDFQKDPQRSGTIYNNTIQASFTKIRDEIYDHIESTSESKLCMIIKTNNGDWRVIPFLEESADARHGKEPSDKNGATLTWTSRLAYFPPAITIA